MTQLVLDLPRRMHAYAPPEIGASIESLQLHASRFRSIVESLGTSASYQPIGASFHPLTSAAYANAEYLCMPRSAEVKAILEDVAEGIPYESLAVDVPIHLSTLEDGSVVLEWVRRDRRLGISLEKDPRESGWFYIYSAGLSTRSEAGSMDQLDLDRLLKLMQGQ